MQLSRFGHVIELHMAAAYLSFVFVNMNESSVLCGIHQLYKRKIRQDL
jgi:hypothetical protein